LDIWLEFRPEVLVVNQPGKVGEHEGIIVPDARMQYLVQAAIVQLRCPRMLFHEQREFGSKADVGQRDVISN
jgi:hypothetical protein